MKLSEVKQILPTLENVEFQLENGTFVPEHFHVTEVGMITKNILFREDLTKTLTYVRGKKITHHKKNHHGNKDAILFL